MLCDRPGRALAVCVNPDQSLPLLDGQRHQRTERSQDVLKPGLMRWVLRSAQQVNTLDWLHVGLWVGIFVSVKINDWQGLVPPTWNIFLILLWLSIMSKALRLFIVLIEIPVGHRSPLMPYMRQGLYSLMIRVNMAHSLHFHRRVGRNNTIAKTQPIWEKKQQETALNGPECTAPEGATSITVTRPKRRTLGEVIAEMEMAVCVFVHVWVCFCAYVWVGGGWIERHSVKRSFRNTLPRWCWRELLIDMHFLTETRAINLSASH